MPKDLSRYSCQMALPGFGEAAQQLLQDAKVLIVGAGGLGCPAAQYLAAAGIGNLGIADFDKVTITNLHRQILYTPVDVGSKKAVIAAEKLQKQNRGIKLKAHDVKITVGNVLELVGEYDTILDCTDNFETRYLLNDACVIVGKPLVYGAIYQFEGQVAVWNTKTAAGALTPNYRDLFPQVNAALIPNCADGGVIPTLAGIIGCMQANEVIKYTTKTGELLAGKMLVFDALTMQSRIIKMGNVTNTTITALTETIIAPVMQAKDVKNGLRDNSVELIDIRTLEERDVIDIGGVHMEADELQDNWDYINNGTTKVLYCSSGKRSAEAVKIIKEKFPDAKVFSLEGGITKFLNLTR
jgi:molybdopterin/thiamine biosynthesis adenylyltransferase/rhodanese-related sulfurtransferase